MAFGKPSTVGKPAGKPSGAPAGFGKPKTTAAAPASSGRRISIKPSDQQAGGLLDDVDVMMKECRFVIWDYNGQQEPGPALSVVYVEEDGKESTQYYSAGKLERMVPSADGLGLEAAPGTNNTGMNDNTNASVFLRSLIEQGFPEEKIDEAEGSVAVFEGTVIHVNRVVQKRKGLQQANEKPQSTLVCTQIKQLPWEAEQAAKPAKAAPKAVTSIKAANKPNGKPAAAPQEQAATGIEDEAATAVAAVLAAEGGSCAKKSLGMKVFRVLGQSPNRSAILNLVATDDFLATEGAPWTFDGTTVSAV